MPYLLRPVFAGDFGRSIRFAWRASEGRAGAVTRWPRTAGQFSHAGSRRGLVATPSSSTDPAWGTTGRLLTSNGAGTGDFTLLVMAAIPAAAAVRALIGQRASTNYSQGILYSNANASSDASSGGLCFFTYPLQQSAHVAGAVDGEFHVYAGRRIASTEISLWVDGRKGSANNTGSVANITESDSKFSIGAAGSGGSTWTHGATTAKIVLGAAWDRALTDGELSNLGRDPWQLFSPAPARVWFFPAGGGSTYNLDFAESASATDSLSSAATLAATIAEAASAADACSSAATLLATVAEALTASDAATSSATLTAAIAESVSAADQVSAGAATYAVDIAEAANLTDAISSVLTAAASVVETASAADTVASAATLIAALAEAVTASDSVTSSTSGSTYSVSVSEAISALDTFSAQFNLAAAIAEAANASDSTTSSAVLAAAVTEALAALDAVSAAGIFGVTITESANATDSVSAPTGFGETPASRTITVTRGGRTITVQLHGRTITVH